MEPPHAAPAAAGWTCRAVVCTGILGCCVATLVAVESRHGALYAWAFPHHLAPIVDVEAERSPVCDPLDECDPLGWVRCDDSKVDATRELGGECLRPLDANPWDPCHRRRRRLQPDVCPPGVVDVIHTDDNLHVSFAGAVTAAVVVVVCGTPDVVAIAGEAVKIVAASGIVATAAMGTWQTLSAFTYVNPDEPDYDPLGWIDLGAALTFIPFGSESSLAVDFVPGTLVVVASVVVMWAAWLLLRWMWRLCIYVVRLLPRIVAVVVAGLSVLGFYQMMAHMLPMLPRIVTVNATLLLLWYVLVLVVQPRRLVHAYRCCRTFVLVTWAVAVWYLLVADSYGDELEDACESVALMALPLMAVAVKDPQDVAPVTVVGELVAALPLRVGPGETPARTARFEAWAFWHYTMVGYDFATTLITLSSLTSLHMLANVGVALMAGAYRIGVAWRATYDSTKWWFVAAVEFRALVAMLCSGVAFWAAGAVPHAKDLLSGATLTRWFGMSSACAPLWMVVVAKPWLLLGVGLVTLCGGKGPYRTLGLGVLAVGLHVDFALNSDGLRRYDPTSAALLEPSLGDTSDQHYREVLDWHRLVGTCPHTVVQAGALFAAPVTWAQLLPAWQLKMSRVTAHVGRVLGTLFGMAISMPLIGLLLSGGQRVVHCIAAGSCWPPPQTGGGKDARHIQDLKVATNAIAAAIAEAHGADKERLRDALSAAQRQLDDSVAEHVATLETSQRAAFIAMFPPCGAIRRKPDRIAEWERFMDSDAVARERDTWRAEASVTSVTVSVTVPKEVRVMWLPRRIWELGVIGALREMDVKRYLRGWVADVAHTVPFNRHVVVTLRSTEALWTAEVLNLNGNVRVQFRERDKFRRRTNPQAHPELVGVDELPDVKEAASVSLAPADPNTNLADIEPVLLRWSRLRIRSCDVHAIAQAPEAERVQAVLNMNLAPSPRTYHLLWDNCQDFGDAVVERVTRKPRVCYDLIRSSMWWPTRCYVAAALLVVISDAEAERLLNNATESPADQWWPISLASKNTRFNYQFEARASLDPIADQLTGRPAWAFVWVSFAAFVYHEIAMRGSAGVRAGVRGAIIACAIVAVVLIGDSSDSRSALCVDLTAMWPPMLVQPLEQQGFRDTARMLLPEGMRAVALWLLEWRLLVLTAALTPVLLSSVALDVWAWLLGKTHTWRFAVSGVHVVVHVALSAVGVVLGWQIGGLLPGWVFLRQYLCAMVVGASIQLPPGVLTSSWAGLQDPLASQLWRTALAATIALAVKSSEAASNVPVATGDSDARRGSVRLSAGPVLLVALIPLLPWRRFVLGIRDHCGLHRDGVCHRWLTTHYVFGLVVRVCATDRFGISWLRRKLSQAGVALASLVHHTVCSLLRSVAFLGIVEIVVKSASVDGAFTWENDGGTTDTVSPWAKARGSVFQALDDVAALLPVAGGC